MSERTDGRDLSVEDAQATGTAPVAKGTMVEDASDAPSENLTIFSAPAVEVVFQWWFESNRRWAAREVAKSPA